MAKRSPPPDQKPRWSKPIEWWLTRHFVRFLIASGRLMSRSGHRSVGRALGNAAWRAMPRYRNVALANLKRAFGGSWSDEEILRVAQESFRVLGISMVEFFLWQPGLKGPDIDAAARLEGQEHYERAFARGKGVILITAHYGNWEMMGPCLSRAGYIVNAISRTADDPTMERTIESIRKGAGVRQIPRSKAAREGLGCLRRNEILAILMDQNTAEGGVFVPFFGHLASTATGPAVFALKTEAALVPTFCLREPDGSYTVQAREPILPEPTGDRQRDIVMLTARLTLAIEDQIRERPELWSWLHNRWKLGPELETLTDPEKELLSRTSPGANAER